MSMNRRIRRKKAKQLREIASEMHREAGVMADVSARMSVTGVVTARLVKSVATRAERRRSEADGLVALANRVERYG